MAKVSIATAEAEAQQRQFELDQRFQNDSRYVGQLAGNYQNYAAGRAMMGAGEGMAKGGSDGGVAGVGAQMAVGMGMAGWMQHNVAQQPVAPPVPPGARKARCPVPSARHRCRPGKFCQECGGRSRRVPSEALLHLVRNRARHGEILLELWNSSGGATVTGVMFRPARASAIERVHAPPREVVDSTAPTRLSAKCHRRRR